ncbi:MAG: Type prenyl endopeptidase Rce1-like [Thermoplasmata archaeon]|jgi:membrane protease YdiL (CAAX protease family)|nr:Type prenyl endopeptidase Rce1-like [Thermoplasmata archaeon]
MPPLTRDQYDLLVLAVAWLGGFAPMAWRKEWTWIQAIGLGLVLTPFVRFGLDFYGTVVVAGVLFHFTVLAAPPVSAFWSQALFDAVYDVGLPFAGLLILHNAVPGFPSRRAPREPLRDALAAHDLAPRATWRRDLARGAALFLFIAAAYLVALLLEQTALAALSANGDETRYWQNITIPLVLLLSALAGVGEEMLFRGVLLTWLSRRMPWLAAALLQALAFGLIHSGYGTWSHVVGPFAFGLGMAWVARHLGVWVTAVLHASVDVVSLGLSVAPDYVATHGTAGALALGAVLLALCALSVWALVRTRGEPVRILWADLGRLAGRGRGPTMHNKG